MLIKMFGHIRFYNSLEGPKVRSIKHTVKLVCVDFFLRSGILFVKENRCHQYEVIKAVFEHR